MHVLVSLPCVRACACVLSLYNTSFSFLLLLRCLLPSSTPSLPLLPPPHLSALSSVPRSPPYGS